MSGYGFPFHPIAWLGRKPVTISELNQTLSMPVKSASPDQPPGWNDPHRILES
jgi:hypothetical protein